MCLTHWKVTFLYLDIIDSSSCAKYPILNPVPILKPNFQVSAFKNEHSWENNVYNQEQEQKETLGGFCCYTWC